MVHLKVSVLILFLATLEQSFSSPGHHVHHRIHIPTKIKTIYHTKIIKVPEHHHYIHEKEKPHLVKVPEHHHYFHEKEKEKPHDDWHGYHDKKNDESLDWHSYHKEDDLELQNDYENDHKSSYDFEEGHNIFKKHAPPHHYKKRRPKPKH